MEASRVTFSSKGSARLEGFLYEPTNGKPSKGIILSVGGSGFSRGGFGGPAAFSRYAQSNSFTTFEWNKRGIQSNVSLTDIKVNRPEYDLTTIDTLVDDAEAALSYMQSKFPNLPVFVFGGSEGSYVTTLLAQRVPKNVSGIASFGTGIAPFIEVIEHQLAGQFLASYCKERNYHFDHKFSLDELNSIAKANEDFLPIVSVLFPSEGEHSKKFSAVEIKNEATKYWLLDVPNRDEYWFNTSASPKGFFESMVGVPSMFDRLEKIPIPTLILHGTLDESAPVQYAYQLQTVCRLRKLNNFIFKFYPNAGHAPTLEMIDDGIKFFQEIIDKTSPEN
jgi:pimeloyl-ACP methyl ester carboxylesterase